MGGHQGRLDPRERAQVLGHVGRTFLKSFLRQLVAQHPDCPLGERLGATAVGVTPQVYFLAEGFVLNAATRDPVHEVQEPFVSRLEILRRLHGVPIKRAMPKNIAPTFVTACTLARFISSAFAAQVVRGMPGVLVKRPAVLAALNP